MDRLLVAYLGIALEATLLTALLLRRSYRVCLSFTLYVVAVLFPSLLFVVSPTSYTWDNYLLREIVHNLLKFAIALELGYRTFRAFPGAWTQAKRVMLAIVVLIGLVVIAAITSQRDPADIQAEWHARVLNGTIWLFTGIAVLILWYRLPVHPFHKAILVGFVPYLLIFSFGMRALVEMGWDAARQYQRFHTLAYLALLVYWNRAAWSRAPATVASPVNPRQAEQPEPA